MSVSTASTFFALLTVAANVLVAAAIALWLVGRVSARASQVGRRAADAVASSALAIAWTVAAVATVGSLFYSEYAGFIPCELCWYQRIAMYPLVVVLGVSAFRSETRAAARYALPLVGVGALISIYHYQLQRFPAQASVDCDPVAPCTLTYVWRFHYISIPFMALSAFALIGLCLLVARTRQT